MLLVPIFGTPQWRPFRSCIFALMALSAYSPLILSGFLYGFEYANQQGAMFYALAAIFYLGGAALYAGRRTLSSLEFMARLILNSYAGPKDGIQDDMIFGAIHIRSSIAWDFSAWWCTFAVLFKRLATKRIWENDRFYIS